MAKRQTKDDKKIAALKLRGFDRYTLLALAAEAYLREFSDSGYTLEDFPDFVRAQLELK